MLRHYFMFYSLAVKCFFNAKYLCLIYKENIRKEYLIYFYESLHTFKI